MSKVDKLLEQHKKWKKEKPEEIEVKKLLSEYNSDYFGKIHFDIDREEVIIEEYRNSMHNNKKMYINLKADKRIYNFLKELFEDE